MYFGTIINEVKSFLVRILHNLTDLLKKDQPLQKTFNK